MNQLSYTVAKSKFESRGFRFKGDLDQAIRDTIQLFQPLVASLRNSSQPDDFRAVTASNISKIARRD
jgi:hypothetical protein